MAGVIVLGDSLKSIFRNLIDKDKIRVVPNCVDDQYLIDNDIYRLKMENLIYKPTLDLLYLSNFMVEKGYRKVLQLALMAKERGEKNLCFHFAGNFFDEKDEQFYWDYIHKYQLDSLVRYHGIVSGGPKKELLALCNVFFLITTYRIEGQPISILEAMGNGMAIITTNHAGIPDIMENNVNGMMVDKKSINLNDIYDYIQQLNNDRSLLINICTRNIENIRNYYTEEQYIDNMNSAFQDVLH
jgi:glycosyltransferase involved in cell wall biosynthesis